MKTAFLAAVSVLAAFVVGIPVWFLVSLYYGWSLSILWGWFMVPSLHLPPLTIPQAMGITLVVGFLTYRWDLKSTHEGAELWVSALIRPLVMLACGWAIKAIFGS